MCSVCDKVELREDFPTPEAYLECLDYIQKLIDSGNFELESQTCDPDKVLDADGYFVEDIICHTIKCKCCGQAYSCGMNTYHGSGRFRKGR